MCCFQLFCRPQCESCFYSREKRDLPPLKKRNLRQIMQDKDDVARAMKRREDERERLRNLPPPEPPMWHKVFKAITGIDVATKWPYLFGLFNPADLLLEDDDLFMDVNGVGWEDEVNNQQVKTRWGGNKFKAAGKPQSILKSRRGLHPWASVRASVRDISGMGGGGGGHHHNHHSNHGGVGGGASQFGMGGHGHASHRRGTMGPRGTIGPATAAAAAVASSSSHHHHKGLKPPPSPASPPPPMTKSGGGEAELTTTTAPTLVTKVSSVADPMQGLYSADKKGSIKVWTATNGGGRGEGKSEGKSERKSPGKSPKYRRKESIESRMFVRFGEEEGDGGAAGGSGSGMKKIPSLDNAIGAEKEKGPVVETGKGGSSANL
jgi:hypothetical protein